MPTELKERLQELIDRTLELFEVIVLGALAIYRFNTLDLNFTTLGSSEQPVALFFAKVAPILLMVVTLLGFFGYKAAVRHELSFLDSAFAEKSAPVEIDALEWHAFIRVIGYALVAAFALMIYFSNDIFLYCVIAMVLNVADLIGSSVVLQNIGKVLVEYPVPPEDKEARFILKRRSMIVEYYFHNPTLLRICVIIGITLVALVISAKFPVTDPNNYLYSVPYAIMLCNYIIGGVVIKLWRVKRDRELREISSDQQKDRKKRKKR